MQSITDFLAWFWLFREAKEEAKSAMFFYPAVGVEIHNRDSTSTPGQWHEMAEVSSNDDSSDENEADVHVLKAYNEAMTRITSLTEHKVKHVSVRLSKEWEEVTANEKTLCLDHVEEHVLMFAI